MIVNPDVDVYTKSRNHKKTLRKTQKNNNLLKPWTKWEPDFYIWLVTWAVRITPSRQLRNWMHLYAPGQVQGPDTSHFRHL